MLLELPALTPAQYSLVSNLFSLAVAAMLASVIFFIAARSKVAPTYRLVPLISAIVVAVAGYHYFRLFHAWEQAYALNQSLGTYQPTGDLYDDAYRSVDWLLTVPLLLVQFVLVLDLPRTESRAVAAKLATAGALMIILGYPGAASRNAEFFGWKGLWGVAGTLPFIYVLFVLFARLDDVVRTESQNVATLLRNARLLLLVTWGFYPVAYMIPMFYPGHPAETPRLVTALQGGYVVADILAKAGFGLLLYHVARRKSVEDGFTDL